MAAGDSSSSKQKQVIAVGGLAVLVAIVIVILLPGEDQNQPDGLNASNGPEQILEEGEEARVVMRTSEGDFTVDLETADAPETTNSFAYLAQNGFYDGLTFHRIVPGFVIQGGDPEGDGTGGPGYEVVEEPPSDLEYEPGVVAMAKGGTDPPGSSGSQFFVVTGDEASSLPPEYALVGRVAAGFEVVERIGRLGGPDQQPTREVTIDEAILERG